MATLDEYILDEDSPFDLHPVVALDARWTEFPHAHQRMRGLVLLAGESIVLPWCRAGREPWLSLSFLCGLPQVSADGLAMQVHLEVEGIAARVIHVATLDNAMPSAGYRDWEVALPVPAGARFRLAIHCDPGPEGRPEADWLALVCVAVGERGASGRLRAKALHGWRLANEVAHFSGVYDRTFYRDRQVVRSDRPAAPIEHLDAMPPVGDEAPAVPASLRPAMPEPGENPFRYSNRLLTHRLPVKPPDYVERLRALHARRDGAPVRMLSLCAGEAGTEGRLLEQAGIPVALCLLDVHEGLLETAASRMPPQVEVRRVLGDANTLAGQLGHFDVINITSGLHHLVELERVLRGIARSLAPGGEFWLIGEQVGRNGNRLWPEAQRVADDLFRAWPEEKRRNANTGGIDAGIPVVDCSSACFEGIRSEEILALLDRDFLPVETYLRNCFLWRLFDVAYAGNFDLSDPADVARVHEALEAEVAFWSNGGVGTELHGVFRSKRAELAGSSGD